MALAVSLALDDLDEPPPPSSPPEPPAPRLDAERKPEPEPIAPAPAPPGRPSAATEPAASATPLELAGSLGPSLSVGTAPDAAVGAGMALALRWPRVAARLDLRGELPASKELPTGGRLATNVALVTGSICLRLSLPFACAVGGAGLVWSRTEGISQSATDRAAVFVASLRFGLDVPLGARVYVEPFVRPRCEPHASRGGG